MIFQLLSINLERRDFLIKFLLDFHSTLLKKKRRFAEFAIKFKKNEFLIRNFLQLFIVIDVQKSLNLRIIFQRLHAINDNIFIDNETFKIY